ncbi:MAG: response regulator [Lachnospiraceae bacterium]|nr:response regulator [Lachnospiraceae bacterium]
MYSVLLVDDEEEVLEVIKKKLDWEALGFEVAGTAANGVEALEFVEENRPDVVLSDIRMPYMDGLEFARQVSRLYPDINIIIFSGFDDFEFAKSAISLGVKDYLLKPIDTAELFDIFKKTRERLDEERQKQNNIERLQQYYADSLPILRESFLIGLIVGTVDKKRLIEAVEGFGLNLTGPYYAVSVIHISDPDKKSDIDRRLQTVSLQKTVEERLTHEGRDIIFSYRDDIVSIVQLDDAADITEYTNECDRFASSILHIRDMVITFGIGRTVSSLTELSSSYGGAVEALSLRVIYGRGTAINIADIEPHSNTGREWETEAFEHVLKQIKLGSKDDVHQAIDKYIQALIDARPDSSRFRLHMMEILTGFYKFLSNNEISADEVGISEKDQYGRLLMIDSAQELSAWFNDIAFNVRSILKEQRNSATRSFVKSARDYVRDHYGDCDLTINDVCSELGVSAAYFSTVFKKETGQTFINYLTDYRMQEAVRMMVEQDEKTYVIAEKVGYADANYFSYVFKKQFGMSPTKYKKQQV